MNTPPPRKSRKVLWLLIFFFGTPVLLCSGILTWWIGRNSVAQGKLDARLKDLQAEGKPIDIESMAIYYDSLTDPRNSEVWISAIEVIDSKSLTERTQDFPVLGNGPEIPPVGQPWPERQQVVDLLAELRPVTERIHEIAQANHTVRFPRKWDSFNTLLPNVQGLRQLSRVLTLEHAVALRDGDAEAQHQAIQSLLGTSLAVRHDPVLVSNLVSIAVHGIAIKAIQESLEHDQLTDEQWASILERLELFNEYHEPFVEATYGELAMGLTGFQNPAATADLSDAPPAFNTFTLLGSRAIDALYFIDMMTRVEDLRHDTLAHWVEDADKNQMEFEESLESGTPLEKMDRLLTALFSPALGAASMAYARATMANRLAISAIALRQWERQNGSFPQSLEQIESLGVKPEQLITIHGDRFGYQVSDNKAIIWAYDPNSTDENNQRRKHVPAEPPAEDAVNEYGDAEAIRRWVWRLPSSE